MPLHHEIAGSGPAVLLLHAAVGDSRIWDPQFEALAGEFTVIRCDLPGFGRSPLPDEPCVDADEVAAVLEATGTARAAVVGNSFGGLVALQLAARHPDRVERLVLFAPSYDPDPDEKLAAYAAEEERLFDSGDYDAFVELNVRTWVQPGVADEHRRLVREMQRLALEIQLQQPDAEPVDVEIDLSAITVPVRSTPAPATSRRTARSASAWRASCRTPPTSTSTGRVTSPGSNAPRRRPPSSAETSAATAAVRARRGREVIPADPEAPRVPSGAPGPARWLEPAALGSDQDGLGAVDRAELAVDVVQVGADRRGRQRRARGRSACRPCPGRAA